MPAREHPSERQPPGAWAPPRRIVACRQQIGSNAKVDELHEWQPSTWKMPSWVASRMTAEHI